MNKYVPIYYGTMYEAYIICLRLGIWSYSGVIKHHIIFMYTSTKIMGCTPPYIMTNYPYFSHNDLSNPIHHLCQYQIECVITSKIVT
jgi:hypothetical protein